MAKYKRTASRRNNAGSRSGGNNNDGSGGDPSATASSLEANEVSRLTRRIREEAPPRGHLPPQGQRVTFRSLPLSDATSRGLEAGKFLVMTDVQNACIPHALMGRDILGAARTGSGKTLAFLVPMLERLYRSRFTPADGPGGIVLSPTRELAVQIFEVLRVVGSFHHLSAGLVVGGKKEFGLEQGRVGRTNALVATPGRLLMHLEQTPDFDVSGVEVLVLDEADRILDMGFRDQMVRILSYLPPGAGDAEDGDRKGTRQTLLFSATQTKKVSDLAALSLDRRPEYLGVHDDTKGHGNSTTPSNLEQSLVVVPLPHKLDAVFSFIKSHLKKKVIVFFSSCSQVRHAWEVFCALRPGLPLMALHGKISQERRTKIYFEFLRKPSAVLFATDVASRGLDFPNVDWVVSADCPEDKEAYIHRVGRTARYKSGGKSLLVLLPQEEEGMTKILKDGGLTVKKLAINPSKAVLVSQRASAIIASKPELNLVAKKAFKSYLRSVHLQPDKTVFPGVTGLPIDEYALSLGLASTPTVRFLKKMKGREEERKKKNVDYKLEQLKDEIKAERLMKKMAKLGGKAPVPKKRKRSGDDDDSDNSDSDSDDDLMVVKQKHEWGENEQESKETLPDVNIHEATKSRQRAAKAIRIEGSSTGANKRIVFDDDGEEGDSVAVPAAAATLSVASGELASAKDKYLQRVQDRLRETSDLDRAEEKERVKEKHRKRRLKDKGDVESEDESEEAMVTLGGVDSEDDDSGSGSGSGSSSDSDSDSAGSGSGESDSGSDSDDEGEGDDVIDIKAQEELALAMLGGK